MSSADTEVLCIFYPLFIILFFVVGVSMLRTKVWHHGVSSADTRVGFLYTTYLYMFPLSLFQLPHTLCIYIILS